jgi:hypothetical protein
VDIIPIQFFTQFLENLIAALTSTTFEFLHALLPQNQNPKPNEKSKIVYL